MMRNAARKVFACFISVFIAAAVVQNAGAFAVSAVNSDHFLDIKGHWAEKSINELISRGLVEGIEVGGKLEVQPDKAMTRAEFITILTRSKEFAAVPAQIKSFQDVSDSAWFKDALDKLTSNSVINGYDDGTFKPNNTITRGEIAAIISRACRWETDENIRAIGLLPAFSDVDSRQWYYISVMINKRMGIINGYPDGRFGPMNNATRAEAFTIFANFIGRTEAVPAPTPTPTPSTVPVQTPLPGTQQTPVPSITPTPTPVYNPSGIINYNIKGTAGSKAYFQVFAFGMKDLGKFEFKVNYDPVKVKAIGVIEGTIKQGSYIDRSTGVDLSSADKGYITIASNDTSTGANSSGTIFTVVFEILADASGSTEVTLTGKSGDSPMIYDTNGSLIQPLSVENGSITVK